MVTFNNQRVQDKDQLKTEYEDALKDYICKYKNFYDSNTGDDESCQIANVTESEVETANNLVNEKLSDLKKNNDTYETKINESSGIEAEDWVDEWNAFKERTEESTKEIKDLKRKVSSKKGLVAQTQVSYNHEYNKFVTFSVFNVIFGLGAAYVSYNLITTD